MRQTNYLTHLVHARIMVALHIAAANVDTGFGRVSVLEKPRRMVRSTCATAEGGLVLVPNATHVHSKLSSDPVAADEVSVVHDTSNNFAALCGRRFVLMPLFTKEMPCAAWAVRSTAFEREANMSWSRVEVSVVGVAEGPAKASAKAARSPSQSSPLILPKQPTHSTQSARKLRCRFPDETHPPRGPQSSATLAWPSPVNAVETSVPTSSFN